MKNKDLDIIFRSMIDIHHIPNDYEINTAIEGIEKRLEEKAINRAKNKPIKEGYELGITILRERCTDLDRIKELSSTRARAIASLAIDYIKGECSLEVLLGVPLDNK